MNIQNSRRYYGEVLSGSADLRTDACCTLAPPPAAVGAVLARVHQEVRDRYYGCGLVVTDAILGARILYLGSGSGQDAYVLAQLVGEHGSVTGVDATPEQIAVADRHLDWHRQNSATPPPTSASSRATSSGWAISPSRRPTSTSSSRTA